MRTDPARSQPGIRDCRRMSSRAKSAGGGEVSSCGEHLGSYVLEHTIAKQSRRRTVTELRIQALQPCLRNQRIVARRDESRHLIGQTKPRDDLRRADLPLSLRPLMDGTGLLHPGEERDQARAQQLTQLFD